MDMVTLAVVGIVALTLVAAVVALVVVTRSLSRSRRTGDAANAPATPASVIYPVSSDDPAEEETLRATKAEIDRLRTFERSYRDALRTHLAALDEIAPDESTRERVAAFRAVLENPRAAAGPTA